MDTLRQEYITILSAYLAEPDEAHLFAAQTFGLHCAAQGMPLASLLDMHFTLIETGDVTLSDRTLLSSQKFLLQAALAISIHGGSEATTIENVLAALYDETVIRFEKELYELNSANERFRTLVQTIPDIVYLIDKDGTFHYLNDTVRSLGYEPDELIGSHFSTIILPSDLPAVSRAEVLKHMAAGAAGDGPAPKLFDERRTGLRKTIGLEVRLATKNQGLRPGYLETFGGPEVVAEINSSGLFVTQAATDDAARPAEAIKVFFGTVGIIRDITTRKQMEVELRSHRDHLETLIGERTAELIAANQELQREIAVRTQIEEALRASEERFRVIFDNAMDGILLADMEEKKFTTGNKRICDLLGYTLEEIKTLGVTDIHPAEDLPYVIDQFERQARGEFSLVGDIPVKRKDGTVFYAEINSTPIILDGKAYLTGIFRDITARKQAEDIMFARLQLSQFALTHSLDELLQATLDRVEKLTNSRIGFYHLLEADQRTLSLQMWSTRTRQELCSAEGKGLHYDIDQAGVWVDCVRERRPVMHNEYASLPHRKGTPPGHVRVIRELVVPVFRGDRIVAILGVGNKPNDYDESDVTTVSVFADLAWDIAERRKSEEALQKSEAFTRDILQSVGEGLIVIDRDFRIISANRAYCEQLRLPAEEVIGRRCYEVSHHRDRPCALAGEECAPAITFKTGRPHIAIHTHYDKDNAPVYIETKSFPMRDATGATYAVIETLNNITEKRGLEEQLRHTQKMEAIGTLAGGIAHDFNNLLTAIIGYGGIMQMQMAADDPLRPQLKEILAAGARATHLTKGLLTFSRKQVMEIRTVNLNEIVEGFKKMLTRIIGEDIELRITLADTALTVRADAVQIEQVLMNLAANARDAMPRGGVLSITTEPVGIDTPFIKTHGYGKPGRYGRITVTDTGGGMDARTRERIFEPYFTTKGLGKGTGLGLSIVYGIVKQHQGYTTCDSEPDQGTTFEVYIPIASRAEATPITEAEAVAVPGGTETILMAEDDAVVRMLLKSILVGAGYTVVEAIDGADAVQKFQERQDDIRLLLLDVVMPVKNGKDAYEDIKAIRHDVKALFLSGYAADIIQRFGIEGDVDFIAKPVTPRDLLRKVRDVLDAGQKPRHEGE